jgi:anhydro-N-acetylmuramic acid kinase
LFLIERIQHYFKGEIIIPNQTIIEFKEAIIFAFLGALYLEKQTNTISSVTGASRNVVGGVYHIPN